MWVALRAALGRAGWFLAVLAGAALLIQVLLWAAPGDPIDLLPNGAELRPLLEAEWGLGRPLPARFATFLVHAAQGDLGTSLAVRPGAPVAELVAAAGRRSGAILLPALAASMALALALAALTRGECPVARGLVQLATVAPVFLLAYLLVIGLNEAAWQLLQAGRIERPAWFALPDQASLLRTALAIGVLAVGSGALGEAHVATETELVRILRSPYAAATRARGAPLAPTVLRNLLPALVALAGRRVPFMVGGLVVVEKVLLLNGAGALLWDACLKRDYPLAMGLALAAALAVAGSQLLADLARLWLDPRLRRENAR